MSFDLSQVMQQAETAIAGTGGGSNYPPIIYPGNGSVSFRLLFNPKSNSVMRLIHRHKLDTGKVDCAYQWGTDCPVCKVLESIKNVKGLDLWTLKSKTYGIAYAQFIGTSAGYDWGTRRVPAQGDLVVMMFPWSVYKQISELIQKSGEHINDLITNNEGKVFTIERKTTSDNRVEYRVDIDAFSPLFKSKESQREFDAFLEGLDDLNDTITPKSLPEGHLNKLALEANNLETKYLSTFNSQFNPGQVPQQPAPQATMTPPVVTTVPTPSPVPQQSPTMIPQQPPQQPPQQQQSPVTPPPSVPVQAPSVPQQPVAAPAPTALQQQVAPAPADSTVQQQSIPNNANNVDGYPNCFGGMDIKNKQCLICPHTLKCSAETKNRKN